MQRGQCVIEIATLPAPKTLEQSKNYMSIDEYDSATEATYNKTTEVKFDNPDILPPMEAGNTEAWKVYTCSQFKLIGKATDTVDQMIEYARIDAAY